MENYTKGDVVEVDMEQPFPLDDSGVDMKVSGGSKIRGLLGFSMKKIKEPEVRQMTWSASGSAINKAISCAEITKRKVKGLHQVTKLSQKRIEEYWEPNIEGLDRLKVNRDVPAISILLSKDPVDTEQPGYQAPGNFSAFWETVLQKSSKPTSKQRDRPYGQSNKSQNITGNKKSSKRKKTEPTVKKVS